MEDVSLPDHRNINHSNFRKDKGTGTLSRFFYSRLLGSFELNSDSFVCHIVGHSWIRLS